MFAPAFVERPARLGLRVAAAFAFLPPLLTRITLGHAFFLTGRGKLANFDTSVSTRCSPAGSGSGGSPRGRRPGAHDEALLRRRLDLRARVEDREVLSPGPGLEQVPVVPARGVAALAGVVEAERSVPVGGVGDDLERAALGLVV